MPPQQSYHHGMATAAVFSRLRRLQAQGKSPPCNAVRLPRLKPMGLSHAGRAAASQNPGGDCQSRRNGNKQIAECRGLG
jgi:hypothetical protein